MKNNYGKDPMKLLEITHLESDVQEIHLTPSDLGKMIGTSGRRVNRALESIGYQTELRDAKNRIRWIPTESGKSNCIIKDTGKRHGDGTPVTQLFWSKSIVEPIEKIGI